MKASKKILIIAGPNGAGKTSFATEFLPNEANCPNFINADLIAAGLNPFRPEEVAIRSGRLMLQMIHDYVRKGQSFAFETTLSGRGYVRFIPRKNRDTGLNCSFCDYRRRRWLSPASGNEFWRMDTICLNRLFAAAFISDGVTSKPSTGIW